MSCSVIEPRALGGRGTCVMALGGRGTCVTEHCCPLSADGHSPAMHTFTAENLMSRLKINPGGASSPRKNIANDIHRPQSLFGADKGRGGFAPVRPMGLGGVSSRAFFTSGSE